MLNYDGERILRNHATYGDFLSQARDEEKDYFVFSSVRNPMDKILSLYFKYKLDHRQYDDPKIYRRGNAMIAKLMMSQYNYVKTKDATFTQFFRRFYYLPYDDWSSLDHERMDYIIHFERLAEGFNEVLQRIGITPVRALPVVNKTAKRSSDFWSYYEPEIRGRAQWVFAPYFRRWGYEFPGDWNPTHEFGADFVCKFANVFRKLYWRHLR
mgnify:CR=1 FL=1